MSVPVIWTEACENVARNAVRGFFAPGMERDDLLQESRIAVCDAVRRYRPNEDLPFEPFAYLCARRRVASAVTAATRLKHGRLNEAVSFDCGVRLPSGEELPLRDLLASPRPDPLHAVLAREDAAVIGAAWDRLTDLEREAVARCAIAGEPYEAVGQHKSIDNALQRARRKLAVAA